MVNVVYFKSLATHRYRFDPTGGVDLFHVAKLSNWLVYGRWVYSGARPCLQYCSDAHLVYFLLAVGVTLSTHTKQPSKQTDDTIETINKTNPLENTISRLTLFIYICYIYVIYECQKIVKYKRTCNLWVLESTEKTQVFIRMHKINTVTLYSINIWHYYNSLKFIVIAYHVYVF